MGILQSTTRLMTSEHKNDEEDGESSTKYSEIVRAAKPIRYSILIFKAIKALVGRVFSSIFNLRKKADPLLPVQDPPILTQPLILETPPISPPPTTLHFHHDDDVSWFHSADRNHHHVALLEEEEEDAASRNFHVLSSEPEEEEIKSIVVVVREERWIKHYSSGHRILLVGEGDFSFSACLANKFVWAPHVIATSLDSQAFLKENYLNALRNVEELRSRGSQVMHGINVATMANHHLLRHLKFDHIIFNFPYAGLSLLKNMPRQSQIRQHQRLVSVFLENAKEMIGEKGEIHITHKTNGFHAEWKVVELARGRRLRLIAALRFNHLDYPGYNTKCGFGGNNCFNCYPSKTYKFGLLQ